MPTAEQRFVSFPNKYGPYDTLRQNVNILLKKPKEKENELELT